MFRFNSANEQIPGLIDCLRWNLQQIGVVPEPLIFNEINAVFLEVGLALGLVELKHGIEIIPFFSQQGGQIRATNAQLNRTTLERPRDSRSVLKLLLADTVFLFAGPIQTANYLNWTRSAALPTQLDHHTVR
jgi:hypothetical protein